MFRTRSVPESLPLSCAIYADDLQGPIPPVTLTPSDRGFSIATIVGTGNREFRFVLRGQRKGEEWDGGKR
jgi:hypothetical protein